MKKAIYKTFIVFNILLLIFVSLIPKRADAFAPAIPIAAVGSFALGVAAAAIIAHELGYEAFSDDAWTYSDALWALASETVKVSVKASYDAAVAAGHKYMTLSQPTLDWIKVNVLGIAAAQVSSPAISTYQYSGSKSYNYNSGDPYTVYQYSVNSPNVVWVRTVNPLGPVYVYLNAYNFENRSMFSAGIQTTTGINDTLLIQAGLGTATYTVEQIYSKVLTEQNGKLKVMLRADFEALQAKAAALAASSAMPTSIALPGTGDFVAHPRNDRTKTAIQNPTTGEWATPDGVAVPEGDLAFEYPKPAIKDGTLTVPIGGVAVDATTGETVGTANPPATDTGPTKTLAQLVTTRFPFSLPWDIYRVLGVLNAPAKAPEIDIDKQFMNMPFRFNYSFAWLDPYMPWFRGFEIIGFVLFLILSTRKLLGGAQ